MSAYPHSERPEDGIPSYLGRLTQAPLLHRDEEIALTRAVQAGDLAARQRLIESNMRLVINIAKAYRNRAMPLEDLIQEGAVGLMQAAERFDPERGFRFSTYATHWIRQAIGRAIDNKSKAIRLPAHVTQSLRKIEKERERLSRDLGHEPSNDELAAAMGILPGKLNALVRCSQELLSLDMTVGTSGSTTLGGLIRDPQTSEPDVSLVSEELLAELHNVMQELNEREQRVMRLRLHADGQPADVRDETVDAIADELKLSRERLRQIELQAIKKLRNLAQRRRLKDLYR